MPKEFPKKFQKNSKQFLKKFWKFPKSIDEKMGNQWNDVHDNISTFVESLPLKKKCVNKVWL